MAPPIRKFLDDIIAALRPMGQPTLVGNDPDTLLRLAVMTASSTIEEQLKRSSSRRKIASDTRVRYATDELVAGYALGCSMNQYWINGAEIKRTPIEKILSQLSGKLAPLLPGIDVARAYKSASAVYAGGVVAGAADPGRQNERQFLETAWKLLSEHTQMYAHNLEDYAVKQIGLHYQFADFIKDAGTIMYDRYMAAAAKR
jgi:hypothetical protein